MLDFLRAIQRPYVVITGWSLVLFLVVTGKPVPDFLIAFSSALTGFLFAERLMGHNGRKP